MERSPDEHREPTQCHWYAAEQCSDSVILERENSSPRSEKAPAQTDLDYAELQKAARSGRIQVAKAF